ncbi:unnamed protein product [Alopecurus aequalis]
MQLGRNRASPARLAKLNALLSNAHKLLITELSWGGMLQVKATAMPVDLSMWLLSCFEPIKSELVILGRGNIPVDADSYDRVFGLPNKGSHVPFDMDPDAISFMNEEYGIENAIALTFKGWCKKIKDMGGVADTKFLRAYIAGVISCFICPTTKCSISPRYYGAIRNLEQTRTSNFCKLAIEQIMREVKNMGAKKNYVCCCLYHFVILYLGSLEVDEDIPTVIECPIHAAAWTHQLIQVVIHKDTKPNGQFGKLRRKLTLLIGDLCTDISRRLGTFVEEYDMIDQGEPSGTHVQNTRSKRQKMDESDKVVQDEDDESSGHTESAEESNDNNDDEDGDGEANLGGNNSNNNNTPDERNAEDGEQCSDQEIQPRSSTRLQKSLVKQLSEGNSHGISEDTSSFDCIETDQECGDEITLKCMIQSARRSLHCQKPEVAQGGNSSSTYRSPFSELKEYMASNKGLASSEINIKPFEPPEFCDTPPKVYAHGIFMEEIALQRRTPQTLLEFQWFHNDDTFRKVTEECFKKDKKNIFGDNSSEGKKRHKRVSHRGKPAPNTSAAPLQQEE